MMGEQTSSHYIAYGSKRIFFELEHRRRKDLKITVFPNLNVEVVAPESASLDKVKAKVRKRASWIVKQKLFFEDFLPASPPKKFISGESFRYLGRQYRLKVIQNNQEELKLKSGYITVYTRNKSNYRKIAQLVDSWYRERAKNRFESRIEELIGRLKKHTPVKPKVALKRMPKRWGSCSVKGRILLNPELIKAPSDCIDFVIMHELCHLIEHNHSPAFYNLLTKAMPDWKKRKAKLEKLCGEERFVE